jgi:hypothetical protein
MIAGIARIGSLACMARVASIARIAMSAGMTSIEDRGNTPSVLSFRKLLHARSVRGQELRNRLRRAQRITAYSAPLLYHPRRERPESNR